jgi:SLA1 homology domain 1, SHD1
MKSMDRYFVSMWSLVIALSIATSMPAAEEFRTWTDVTGRKVDAAFGRLVSDQVNLRLRNGTTTMVPLTKLSSGDQGWVTEQSSAKSASRSVPVAHAAGSAASAPSGAMWVYETDQLLESAAARLELFQFCTARKIVDLFLQAHYESKAKEGPFQIRDAVKMKAFLKEASGKGLRVHALSGDPSHVLSANHEKVLARVDALAAFNKSSSPSSRFAGIHFDIEPHAMPEWKTSSDEEKCKLLTQFVEVNAKAVEKLRKLSPGTLYGADIAFWLDKVNEDGSSAYPVTFRGVTKDATKHLLDMVDNLGTMSYRDTSEGRNGMIALVERSIAYADTAKGRVFVGVKMADIGPKMESYFGRTEQEMNAEIHKVEEAYAAHRGYAGLAFFMYSAFKTMPQQGK